MTYEFQIDFGNGFEVVPQPLNHSAIKIELAFTSQTPSASIQSIAFEWMSETAFKINNYVNGGNSGQSNGIYEGLPLKILVCNTSLGFDLVLDLANKEATFEADRVVCPFLQVGGVDWFSNLSAGFSFWYLAGALTDPINGYKGAGQITLADFKKTPYCISTIPNYGEVIILSASLLGVTYQISQTVTRLSQAIDKLASDATATPLFLVGAAGGVALLVGDILIVVAEIIYLFLLLNTYITLLNEIGSQIIQEKKYKYCMREKDLFIKACEYMGLTFNSTIFAVGSPFENETWMPKKIVMPDYNIDIFDILNNPIFKRPANEAWNTNFANSYGYYDGSVQQFIQDMCTKYNASVVIINGVAHFEEIHHWNTKNPYKVPNTSELGYVVTSPDPHGTNANECPGALLVEFQTDTSDLNTVQDYRGTSCQVIVAPKKTGNPLHLLTPAGQTIQLPCALGKRKSYLTSSEVVIGRLIPLIDGFTAGLLNGCELIFDAASYTTLPGLLLNFFGVGKSITDFLKKEIVAVSMPVDMNDRIGWLLLSNDSFSIPKSFIGYDDGGDWKLKDAPIDSSGNQVQSAYNFVNNFHGKNLATRGNQYFTYTGKTFPFCCEDFLQVLNNNILITPSGEYGKFTKFIWNLEDEKAEQVDYRINTNFTNNLIETVIVDGAQITP